MAARPEQIAALADTSRDEAIDTVLAPEALRPVRSSKTDWNTTVEWWVEEMTSERTGLTDRMTWFWHGLLTTNAYKVSNTGLISEQLQAVRDNARGNFRTLLHAFVTSGPLLEFLDASGSLAARPNENLGRELLELFTIGRGQYTEDDVRAAARALAGWVVEEGAVEFRRENAFIAPLVFLGEQADWDTALIVDRLCDHPATARRIAVRLWITLVGSIPTDAAASELGAWWQKQDLDIDTLIERILRDRSFFDQKLNRPRSGLEWFCAVQAATGVEVDNWRMEHLGQKPYLPPSVAGWPDDRWVTPGSLLTRLSIVNDLDLASLRPEADPDRNHRFTVTDLLDRCGLWTVSDTTVAALETIATSDELDVAAVARIRWRLALSSPEFNLC